MNWFSISIVVISADNYLFHFDYMSIWIMDHFWQVFLGQGHFFNIKVKNKYHWVNVKVT